MKKIKIILLLVLSIFLNIHIKALVPNIIYQPGIYGNKVQGSLTFYGQLGYIYIDNKLAYCIEPYKLVGNDYIIDSSVKNSFTQNDLNYFTLLSYYGYNNTNHNNIYYYMATQELIWRRITGQEVYWTTENVAKGDRINIESYKNEILNSISRHNLSISFGNPSVRGDFRQTVVLEDTNNVLQYYKINNQTSNKVWKEGNKLYITIMSSQAQNITLERKFNNGTGNVFYSSNNNQAIGTFALNETKRQTINVQATNQYSMKLNVIFKDKNTKEIIQGRVKFKIKDLDNQNYLKGNSIFETDETGIYLSDFYVEEGNYQIEIISVPPNYTVEEGTKFEIVENPSIDVIDVENFIEEAKGKIEIKRIFDMTELGKEKINVPDVNYEIYAAENIYNFSNDILYNKNELVDTIITDKQGEAITNLLPLGKYYIKEILDNSKITKDETIYEIVLIYKDVNTKIITEKLKILTKPERFDWKLEVEEHRTKCINEKCTTINNKLENIEYGIYADEDIIINDKTIIKKGDLIIKAKTDENGIIDENISLLKGNYIVKELTDMSIYEEKFRDIKISFNNEKQVNSKIIKTIKEEQKTNKLLPKTIDRYFKYYIICITMFMIGFLGIVYGFKKN